MKKKITSNVIHICFTVTYLPFGVWLPYFWNMLGFDVFCCKQPEMNIWTQNRNAGCYWLIQKQRYFWRNWWYVTKNEVFFINDNWILIWYNQIKLYCVFWIIIVIDFSRLFSKSKVFTNVYCLSLFCYFRLLVNYLPLPLLMMRLVILRFVLKQTNCTLIQNYLKNWVARIIRQQNHIVHVIY